MLTVHRILMSCLRAKQKTGVWTKFFCFHLSGIEPGPPAWQARILPPNIQSVVWWYTIYLHCRVLLSLYFHLQFSLQVALWGFTGSIPPKFVLKLYSSWPLTNIWKNYKDEMKRRHSLFGNWKTVLENPPPEKFMHFVLICICILFWFSVHLVFNSSS